MQLFEVKSRVYEHFFEIKIQRKMKIMKKDFKL